MSKQYDYRDENGNPVDYYYLVNELTKYSNELKERNKEIERLNNGIERINSIYRSMQFSSPENQYVFINKLGEVLKELKGSDE